MIAGFTYILSPVRQWVAEGVNSVWSASNVVMPSAQEYNVSFHTLQLEPSMSTSSQTGMTTRIQVNIHHWMVTGHNTLVFMFLTSKNTPVESYPANTKLDIHMGKDGFMELLWSQINAYVSQHHLVPIPRGGWYRWEMSYNNVLPGWIELRANTTQAVKGGDWRLVIVATHFTDTANPSQDAEISWIKIVRPNVALNGSELETDINKNP